MAGNSGSQIEMVTLTADIVAAHVSHNMVEIDEIGSLIEGVYAALSGLAVPVSSAPASLVPAVSVRASVRPDYIICLEDGKKLKMLKRYLMTHYQMTPDEYRAKWGLPPDYPMVAASHAAQRRALAHRIGLGRKPRADRKAGDFAAAE
jgi:predicted transcriptional regulator